MHLVPPRPPTTLQAPVTPYTLVAYNKFNGGTRNYDGFGRNTGDNNTLYLLTWVAF